MDVSIQTERLQAKIIAMGGTIPAPWEWAVIKRYKGKRAGQILVDGVLYNLQLLELKEDLEKKAKQ
jgi:hypothetical protein